MGLPLEGLLLNPINAKCQYMGGSRSDIKIGDRVLEGKGAENNGGTGGLERKHLEGQHSLMKRQRCQSEETGKIQTASVIEQYNMRI